MRLILVRHAETQWNLEGRVQGRNADGLTERGRQQALALAEALAQESLTAVYSSPLARAVETASPVAQRHRLPVRLVEALQEADAGLLEGLPSSELRQQFPEFMAAWSRDAAAVAMPGGESLGQVQERVWQALQEIVAAHPDGTVAVVSHNFALQSLLCRFLGMPLNHFRRLRLDLAAWAELEVVGERVVLVALNETSHLRHLKD